MSLKIILYPDALLREVSQPVQEITDEIKDLAKSIAAKVDELDAVGLSAIQVGVPVRVAVVRDNDDCNRVIINPVIVEQSEEQLRDGEGCWSIPGIWKKIMRPSKCIVEALDLDGNMQRFRGIGRFTRVLLHEIDHMDGILFIDHLSETERSSLKGPLRRLRAQTEASRPQQRSKSNKKKDRRRKKRRR